MAFVEGCIEFKKSPKYNLRQTFVWMCDGLMRSSTDYGCLFKDVFLQHFFEMLTDKVVNVRMTLALVLAHNTGENMRSQLSQDFKIQEMVRRL